MACVYKGEEYSDGSEICQAGTVKRCVGDKWVDIGRDCEESIHNIGKIPAAEMTAEELSKYVHYESGKPGTPLTMYYEQWSLQRSGNDYIFNGGPTPGHVCTPRITDHYRVPIDNVIGITRPDRQCQSDFTVHYGTITYYPLH